MNRRNFLGKIALAGAAVPLLALDVAKVATERGGGPTPPTADTGAARMFPWQGYECIPKGDPGARIWIKPTNETRGERDAAGRLTGEVTQYHWVCEAAFDGVSSVRYYVKETAELLAKKQAEMLYVHLRMSQIDLSYSRGTSGYTVEQTKETIRIKRDDRNMTINSFRVVGRTPEGRFTCDSVLEGLRTMRNLPTKGEVTSRKWGMDMHFLMAEDARRCPQTIG